MPLDRRDIARRVRALRRRSDPRPGDQRGADRGSPARRDIAATPRARGGGDGCAEPDLACRTSAAPRAGMAHRGNRARPVARSKHGGREVANADEDVDDWLWFEVGDRGAADVVNAAAGPLADCLLERRPLQLEPSGPTWVRRYKLVGFVSGHMGSRGEQPGHDREIAPGELSRRNRQE